MAEKSFFSPHCEAWQHGDDHPLAYCRIACGNGCAYALRSEERKADA